MVETISYTTRFGERLRRVFRTRFPIFVRFVCGNLLGRHYCGIDRPVNFIVLVVKLVVVVFIALFANVSVYVGIGFKRGFFVIPACTSVNAFVSPFGFVAMKPTVPTPVKRVVAPRVRKPDKPMLRLIDRTTITVDVAKCIQAVGRCVLAVAALVGATNAPTVATAITKAAIHLR